MHMIDFASSPRLLTAAAIILASGTSACDEPEVPVTPYPDGGYAIQTDAGAPPPPPPPPTAVVPAEAPPCDGTQTVALQQKLKASEATEVKSGMKPETTFMCKMLQQGQSATLPMTAQPGTCYTVVAVSNPNVSEVDVVITLDTSAGTLPPVLAPFIGKPEFFRDGMSGPNATIGRKPHCVTNFLPIAGSVLVKVTATTGSGPVAVQVYSKPGT